MGLVQWTRDFLHKKYVRAVAVGLSVVIGTAAFSGMATKLETGASYTAMYRLVTYSNHGGDLQNLVERIPEQHEELFELVTKSDSSVRTGGFVYANDGELQFYPHVTVESAMQEAEHNENLKVYPKLAAEYHRVNIAGFVNVLKMGEVIQRLHADNLPTDTTPLEELEESPRPPEERLALFRARAYKYVEAFSPFHASDYDLTFGERLRFYEHNNPPGKYVGTFESFGVNVWGDDPVDLDYAHQRGDSTHYLTLMQFGEDIIIRDFYDGEEEVYTYNLPTRKVTLEESLLE